MFSHSIYALEGKIGVEGYTVEREKKNHISLWVGGQESRSMVLKLVPQGDGHQALFCMNYSNKASLPVSWYLLLVPGYPLGAPHHLTVLQDLIRISSPLL